MNKSRNKRKPKYICDRCNKEIPYSYRKGFLGIHKYYKQNNKEMTLKKDFDLCNNCEIKLKKWLKTKEIETREELLKSFPIWKNS